MIVDAMTTSGEQYVKGRDPLTSLEAAALAASHDPASAFALLPWLGASIEADAAAGRFAQWSRSTVVDENTGTAVVPEALFAELHARARLPARFPIGNAGLLHVYGYLLSREPTPYGLKRERWLDGELARAYGLEPAAFLPWRGPGTLLARVSCAALRLVDAHPTRAETAEGAAATIALSRTAGPAALAYALERDGRKRLVTTFPVADAAELLAGLDAGPPRLRWNAAAFD